MALLSSEPGPTSQRTLRYNAKTSLSTRYADDLDQPKHLLRSTNGIPAPDTIAVQASAAAGLKPVKKGSRQEDPDYIDEPEPEASDRSNKPQTRSSAPQTKSSTPSMQLAYELDAACDADPDSMSNKSQPQSTLFICACSLPCNRFSLTASAAASSQTPASVTTMLMNSSKACTPVKSALHWHIHTHSAGPNPHSLARHPDFIPDNKYPCIELQVLEGALTRMYNEKPWPADSTVLVEFHSINGRYEYEVVGDYDRS